MEISNDRWRAYGVTKRDDVVLSVMTAEFRQGDSRLVLQELDSDSVATVITSPPYGDLKDYGHPNQIGHGQNVDSGYFDSMRSIFEECERLLVTGGALWLVADNIRRDGELKPLPWKLMELAEAVGFKLCDIIVWDKGRSLPWTHKGRFRSRIEHVILLSKGELKRFDVEAVRTGEHLSPYWVRYPERYHPLGSAPSDLWHFPIPTQGSWNSDSKRHLCPFPPELVQRMILLTSSPGDLIVDPFSGLGTVPHVAVQNQRRGLGIELNETYIKMARDEIGESTRKQLRPVSAFGGDGEIASELIVKLRIQKYAKLIMDKYASVDREEQPIPHCKAVLITDVEIPEIIEDGDEWGSGTITLLLEGAGGTAAARAIVRNMANRPPLSKFGLAIKVDVRKARRPKVLAEKSAESGSWYLYRSERFYRFESRRTKSGIQKLDDVRSLTKSSGAIILSEIALDVRKPSDG